MERHKLIALQIHSTVTTHVVCGVFVIPKPCPHRHQHQFHPGLCTTVTSAPILEGQSW